MTTNVSLFAKGLILNTRFLFSPRSARQALSQSSCARLSAWFVLLLLIQWGAASAKQLPIEAYGALPRLASVTLSPRGQHVAYLKMSKGSRVLVIHNLELDHIKGLIREEPNAQINWDRWLSDKYLGVSVRLPMSRNGHIFYHRNLLNFDSDGKSLGSVFRRARAPSGPWIPQYQDIMVSSLPDEPEHVLMAGDWDKPLKYAVYKVNLRTGRLRKQLRAGKNIRSFRADHDGVVRLGYAPHKDKIKLYHRPQSKSKWSLLGEYREQDVPQILGFSADKQKVYRRVNPPGGMAIGLSSLDDLRKTTLLARVENADLAGRLVYSQKSRDYVGAYVEGESGDARFWNSEWQHVAP